MLCWEEAAQGTAVLMPAKAGQDGAKRLWQTAAVAGRSMRNFREVTRLGVKDDRWECSWQHVSHRGHISVPRRAVFI